MTSWVDYIRNMHWLPQRWREMYHRYLPLFLVFLSGLGFSIQTLVVKLLSMNGYEGSFSLVLSRGICQLVICSWLVYIDEERRAGKGPSLFGDTNYVRWMLFLRSVIGFGGIAFSFLATEKLAVGDSSTLTMMSPIFAAIMGIFILHEPWRLPEFFASIMALAGAVLVAKPSFLFGGAAADEVGVILALISAITAGIAFICIRILGTSAKMPYANVCVSQSLAQIFLSIPGAYIANQPWTLNVGLYNAVLIFTGGFIGCFSQIAMTIGMQREKSAAATAMRMSDVFFGYIWQILFTADAASGTSILGAILVISSIFVIILFKPKDQPAKLNVDAKVAGDTVNPIDNSPNVEDVEIELFTINIDDDDKENKNTANIDTNMKHESNSMSSMLQWNQIIRSKIKNILKREEKYDELAQESRHG